jgi:hypothetical protein
MGAHRVVAIEVGSPGRRNDPHPAAVQLDGGRQVSSERVISDLRYGTETYHVEADGQVVPLRVVGPCAHCGLAYLRADSDAIGVDRLMRLPRSSYGPSLLR